MTDFLAYYSILWVKNFYPQEKPQTYKTGAAGPGFGYVLYMGLIFFL